MKQFEKWFTKSTIRDIRKPYCKDTWKAALMWVQSRFEFGSEVAYSTDDILMAVKKEIREELEGE